ncbi:uncharacterized protein LOC129339061 [Eublepharis macularius]|uniref:Uncharacterized protein LOC129339061 n=1 Tax=Eublepharis macularius TaxID=481883 RepID=A0AA97K1G4_EUBMA|nr:uncharacterized protein LOC129339061 [Eublepharis macularius]
MGSLQLTTVLLLVSVSLCEVASQNFIKNPKEKMEHLLLINEVNADNPGDDTTEYVELYHTSGRRASLDGYFLVFYNGNGNSAYRVKDLKGFSTDSQGFFLIGSSAVTPRPSVILQKNTIQNGPDAIAVYFGKGSFYEGMMVTNKDLVDALVHKSKISDKADDLVRILTPGTEPFLEDPLFRTADESLERCQGADARWFFQVAMPTPGSDNHCVPFAQLNATTALISEVNVASSPGEFEFVELQGPSSTDLKDLVMVLIEGSTGKIYFVMEVSGRTSPDGLLLIGPGQAGTQVDLPFPPNSSVPLLKAGLNAVALYTGVSSSFALGSVASASNLLDALVYTTVEGSSSKLRDILTPGKPVFYGRERSQQGNTSMSRCACCSTTRDPSIYTLGKPTPRSFNDCPKKRFSQEISLCLQAAGCPQESPEQHNIVTALAQALDKRSGSGVSPVHFRDVTVACQGSDLMFTALLMARSAEQLTALLRDFSLFSESKEVVDFGEWNSTAATACARDANVTETPLGATSEKPGATKEPQTPQAELLINEVNPDNPGAREDTEYIELFYPGLAPFDLRGYWLVLYNGKNNLAYKVVNLTGHRTDEHGYFLVGSDGVIPKPLIVLPPNTIQNGVDAVALYHSTTATYQINMALTSEGLVDAVVYKSRGSEKADKLLAVLAPGQSVLYEDDSHSHLDESLSRCHSLKPRNHRSFQVTAITPFQENACLPLGSNSTEEVAHNHSVLINEVGLGNSSILYQFFELKGIPGTSLKGYSLAFFSGWDHKPYMSIPLQGTFGSSGLFVILPERQARPGKAHDQLIAPYVWSKLSAQQEFQAVVVTSRVPQVHNGTLMTGENIEDAVAFTLEANASPGHLGFLGPIHVISKRGERPVSLSRCSYCSTTFAVSETTPGLENSCPQESLSMVFEICLQTPNCSMWSQNPSMLARFQRALADSMEENCSCGISPCYLQGFNFTCFSSVLKLSGQLWARSSEQLQLLSKWQADFSRSPHPFLVDGRLLKPNRSCSESGRTLKFEASFRTWEIALVILGSVLLFLLLTGIALYYIKRRPQNYTTIEMNDRCEIMEGI